MEIHHNIFRDNIMPLWWWNVFMWWTIRCTVKARSKVLSLYWYDGELCLRRILWWTRHYYFFLLLNCIPSKHDPQDTTTPHSRRQYSQQSPSDQRGGKTSLPRLYITLSALSYSLPGVPGLADMHTGLVCVVSRDFESSVVVFVLSALRSLFIHNALYGLIL